MNNNSKMENTKYKISLSTLITSIFVAFLLLFSSCLPWAPGIGSPDRGGMGGMMGRGGMGQGGMGGEMGQHNSGGMMGGNDMEDMMRRMHGGGGMMRGNDMEDMMRRMHGGGGMGERGGVTGPGIPNTADTRPLTIEQAVGAARKYISVYGPDLILSEALEFARNFYAVIEEKASGLNAMELLVDRYTGQVYPEMGPNMMWNTKYGMMAASPRAEANLLSPQEAISRANEFLYRAFPGSIAGGARSFYGYYTLDILRDSKIEGMLSVNSYSGQIWYHDWHGPFLSIKKLKE